MFSLQNIQISFDDQTVLAGISLFLDKKDRAALIGENGSGKTTLLRIAAGLLKPDLGQVTTDKNYQIGYLPQNITAQENETVNSFLGEASENSKQKVLAEVGLNNLNTQDQVSNLSGGQKTRLAIARILLLSPNILLLDEPTNNLDKEGLEWLRQFMLEFPGAILFTSHDRYFLDQVATRAVELAGGGASAYGGNYTFMRGEQEKERRAHMAKFEAQEGYKKRLLADIEKTKNQSIGVEQTTIEVHARRYAKKVARKAVVRQARLTREMEGVDWLEKAYEEDPVYLPMVETFVAGGKIVLEIEHLGKSFEGRAVLRDFSLQIVGPKRVLLSGLNGSGKSTLLNIISGDVLPDGGLIKVGAGVRVGYLRQELVGLCLTETGRGELLKSKNHPTRCFQYARALGLTISDLEKPISELSRGQQTKLSLVKILLDDPNFLILDEPTNHLELESREAMEKALAGFKGAILVVSHDLYFVKALGVDFEIELG